MSLGRSTASGNGDGDGQAGRHFRFDETPGTAGPDVLGPRRSGRRFVIVGVAVVLAVAGGLGLAFRAWKVHQLALAEFGARNVAPVVDPLAGQVPPGVTKEEWGRVVAQAHRLLVALTGSGTLDRNRMEALRDELRERVDSVRPETAALVLNGLWTDLEDRAGPVLTRAPKFQVPATVHPLASLRPPDVSPDDWALALLRTRAALAAASDPVRMSPVDRHALQENLLGLTAGVESEEAVAALADVWNRVGPSIPEGFERPEIAGVTATR